VMVELEFVGAGGVEAEHWGDGADGKGWIGWSGWSCKGAVVCRVLVAVK
jgi:hypothetical protein